MSKEIAIKKIKLDFYDENGHISESNHNINPLDSLVIENPVFESSSKFIWVTAKSDFPQLHMFSIHTNNSSKYTSGNIISRILVYLNNVYNNA